MVVDEIASQGDRQDASDGKPSRKCWVACVMIAASALRVTSTGCTAWTGAQAIVAVQPVLE
jgi:hypothetical protein